MLFKLSLRNARRQAKDYAIYFVSIVLAVALMFAFNSLGDSEEIKSLSEILRQLPVFMVFTSVVVVVIMGWLIYYIMKFMLEKRSYEFGTYLLMGLEKKQVVGIFFVENVLLGSVAFVLGILGGNVIFQGLRAILLSLYDETFVFSFDFSMKAMGYTLVYIILMYVIALYRSRRKIRKTKVYDLLYADNKNEEVKAEGKKRKAVGFGISLVMMAIGMMFLLRVKVGTSFIGATIVIIALYIFFINFSTGIVAFFEKRPMKKYKGSNLMVFRLLTSKLRTMGIVMATIAVLFTITIVSEGAGLQFINQFQRNEELRTNFDFYVSNAYSSEDLKLYKECLQKNDVDIKGDYEYQIYYADNTQLQDYLEVEFPQYWHDYKYDTLMKMSDYVKLRKMLGYEEVSLEQGKYIIHGLDVLKTDLDNYQQKLKLGNDMLEPDVVYTENLTQYLWGANGDGFIFVVPDELVEGREVANNAYAVMTVAPLSSEQYERLVDIRAKRADMELYDDIYAKGAVEEDNSAAYAMIIFPLFYLALILTMTAMTILTVQMLSETNRYKKMFALLNKLGQSKKDERKTINKILGTYYLMPVIPAIVISVLFLLSFSKLFDYGVIMSARHIAMILGGTVGIFLLVYLLYVAIAYVSFKRNVISMD
jgi:ABC-type antimicrobial peptide transport system, permease component